MKSLYEQNPENWDKLAAQGKPNLRDMAKRFHVAADMDRALGVVGAAHHWNNGRNGASGASENSAKIWLEKHNATTSVSAPMVAPHDTKTRMLLIVATPDQAAKIEKIAALIGAEVTDV